MKHETYDEPPYIPDLLGSAPYKPEAENAVLIKRAQHILAEYKALKLTPLTVRQVYYRLSSGRGSCWADRQSKRALHPASTSRDAPRMAAFGPEAEAPVISRSLRVHGLGKALQLCVGRRDARWLHALVTHEVSPRRVG